MKKILLFALFFSLFTQIQAQQVACMPDTLYRDSAAGAYPKPFLAATNSGGIANFPACVGEPYNLVFTIKLGDSIAVQGLTLNLIRAEIATTGAVQGLPTGVNYFCNPPNCIFPDTTLGCIVLRGTVAADAKVGDNNLVISAAVILDLLGKFATTIPGPVFPGEYILKVKEKGACKTTGVEDYLIENVSLANIPNPVVDRTLIEVTSLISGKFDFKVFDMAGKQVFTKPIELNAGYNSFTYDASQLNNGMYIYSIHNEYSYISEKMVVKK